MFNQYNVVAEFAFLCFALLTLFLMLYTKPHKTKIYIINFLGIVMSIITTIVHLYLIKLSTLPDAFNKHLFDTVCILFLLLYITLLNLLFNYIMLLSPQSHMMLRRIYIVEISYSALYIGLMYMLLCIGKLYRITPAGVHFTMFFHSYFLLGLFDAAFCLITTYINRKYLANIITMCIYIFVPVDIALLIFQMFNTNTVFISITYIFPLVIFYVIFHSNPYNDITCCQNEYSFATRFTDNVKLHRKFTVIHIKITDFKIDGHYHLNKQIAYVSATKCRKIEALSHKIHLYSLSENSYAIFMNTKNVKSLIESIRIILEEPIEYHNAIITTHYKMIVTNNNPYTSDTQQFKAFVKYISNGFGQNTENECIICEKEHYENFTHQYKIKRMLIDIRNNMELDDKRVLCYTQPIYSIEDGTFRTAEALMRLEMEGEIIYPDKFISIAEQTGCIHALTCIMLNKVCRMIKKLEGKCNFDAITVNCSTIEMSNENLHNELLEIIKNNRVDCSKIRLELTESAMINDYKTVSNNMQMLNNAGVRFYLDDFGTGYSNLERIITFPFMTIKFDKSILYKALNDENMDELVSSMVDIFKKRGFVLLVEGVENDMHNEYCVEHGFDYIQGYKYAKPIPISDLDKYFEKVS